MGNLIAYKDMVNNCWWEDCGEHGFLCHPFGHYVFTVVNTCASLSQGKEIFVENEYFYQTHSIDSVSALILASKLDWLDEYGVVSKEKMGEYYDRYISSDKRIEKYQQEYTLLREYIKNLDGFRNGKNSTSSLYSIYEYFKYFSTCISSDIYPYMAAGEERNSYFDSIYDKLITYKGHSFIKKYTIPVEKFEFAEECDFFILDFWEFLFNPIYQKSKIHVCPNCNSIFASNNNKARYCEVCKQPEIMGKIRYRNRKENKARKLHQDILTIAYKLNKTKHNECSNAFLNESNYYWDVVRGKKPEKIKGYSAKIKTESDYMKWLEKKYEELKNQK